MVRDFPARVRTEYGHPIRSVITVGRCSFGDGERLRWANSPRVDFRTIIPDFYHRVWVGLGTELWPAGLRAETGGFALRDLH